VSQHRHLMLTKSIIALLFFSSLQIAVMPANASALFLSGDLHPCSRTSIYIIFSLLINEGYIYEY